MKKPPAGRAVKSTERAMARTNHPIEPDVIRTRSGDSLPASQARGSMADGYKNVATALGTSRDKRTSGGFCLVRQLTRIELESMYRGNWVAAKIVDAVAEDATRKWVNLSWDGRDTQQGTVKTIQVAENFFALRDKVTEAVKWARLYGGAAIVIGVKGQDDWAQPLKMESIGKGGLEMLHVLDRWRLAATGQIDSDRRSPNFGKPLFYTIAEAAESVALVHWSRVVVFHGKRLPYFEWQRNGRWHDSVLQNLEENVRDYESTRAGIASMVNEANVDILAIPGLAEMLSQDDGEQKVIERVQLGAMLKSMIKVWLIDGGDLNSPNGGEKYIQKTTAFSGVNEVFEKVCMTDICGASSIPMTRMFGSSAKGLNATGKGDADNYDAQVGNYQTSELFAPLMKLYEAVVRHAIGSFPKNFTVEFNPLSEESANERSDNQLKRAQRDQVYFGIGAATEGLIARELKDDGIYRTMEDADVKLAEELAKEPDEPVVAPGVVPGKKQPGAKAPAAEAEPAGA